MDKIVKYELKLSIPSNQASQHLKKMGVNSLESGKIIEDGTEHHLMKKVRKSENM